MERAGVDTTGENLSRLRRDRVVRARESGERIQQNHYVLAVLDQPLRLFQNHVRHLNVTRGALVERRAHDLRARSAGDHLGHFLWPLVDQQHDDCDLRMILGDRVGHLVKQDCLSRARGRHDDAALAFANRCHDIDDAHAEIAVLRLESEPLIGILWAQVVERDAILGLLGIFRVDALDLEQREVPFPRLGRPYLSTDLVSRSQAESLYLRRRDVDVVRPREVAPVLAPQKPVPLGQNLQYAITVQHDVGIEQILLDLEDEILLPETRGAVNLEPVGHLLELGHGFSL